MYLRVVVVAVLLLLLLFGAVVFLLLLGGGGAAAGGHHLCLTTQKNADIAQWKPTPGRESHVLHVRPHLRRGQLYGGRVRRHREGNRAIRVPRHERHDIRLRPNILGEDLYHAGMI